MSVVSSLSALSVYVAGREEKQAVALQRWLLISTFFISKPSMRPVSQEHRAPALTCCSFLQGAPDISWWGRETSTGNLFKCSDHRISCLILSLSLLLYFAKKDMSGRKEG